MSVLPGDSVAPTLRRVSSVSTRGSGDRSVRLAHHDLPMFTCGRRVLTTMRDFPILVLINRAKSKGAARVPRFLIRTKCYERGGQVTYARPEEITTVDITTQISSRVEIELNRRMNCSIHFRSYASRRARVGCVASKVLLQRFVGSPSLRSCDIVVVSRTRRQSLRASVLLNLIGSVSGCQASLGVVVSDTALSTRGFSSCFRNTPVFSNARLRSRSCLLSDA